MGKGGGRSGGRSSSSSSSSSSTKTRGSSNSAAEHPSVKNNAKLQSSMNSKKIYDDINSLSHSIGAPNGDAGKKSLPAATQATNASKPTAVPATVQA